MTSAAPPAPGGNAAPAAGPLAGIRVIDFTHMLSGPFCSWVLGALGADVIKIEIPGRGDFTRGVAPFVAGESLYFGSVNRNKRSLTLNLKSPGAAAIIARLIEGADVLIENNRPGVMARLNLGYETLSALNPRLVYASISGFGQTGPYSARPAFDAVVQAMAGMMSITGEPGRGPVRVGASIGDITASLFAATGILAALQERTRTGRGTRIDVAMLDAQLALLENALARYLNTGEVPGRIGSRHPLIAPFQAFETADDPIVVCCDTEPQWAALCRILGQEALLDDPRFADGNARVRNHGALEPLLSEALAREPRARWLERLAAADIPCSPINTMADVAADPQIAARHMIVAAGAQTFVALPIAMPSREGHVERAAPKLGEHSAAILEALGYSAEEIGRLRSEGVV